MTRHYFFCGETCHDLAQNLIFKTNILLCETSCWDRRCVLTEKTRINLFFPRIFKFLSYLGTTQLSKFRDIFRNIFYKTIYRETFSVSVLLLTLTPLLKLCLNKKGQTFVGMLVIWILFLNLNQLPAAKKKGFKKQASQYLVFLAFRDGPGQPKSGTGRGTKRDRAEKDVLKRENDNLKQKMMV